MALCFTSPTRISSIPKPTVFISFQYQKIKQPTFFQYFIRNKICANTNDSSNQVKTLTKNNCCPTPPTTGE